uniref:Uncharacterized protein n=1 Tax=Setaria digitata TaxID=48799 RepID=A0A915PUS7_9BILA
MKRENPVDMDETTEDEDGSASKNFNNAIIETDDGTRIHFDGNLNDDGMMDFECATNSEICIISIGKSITIRD